MEYQNKLSRLRQAFLKIQGQDLKQVLLRAAAKEAEGIAKNVYTTEEIFRAITDKIYEATNELSWNAKFELVSDAESLAILKKELIDATIQEFEWEETLFLLLEGLDKKQKALLEPLLRNQYQYYIGATTGEYTSMHNTAGFYKLMVPIVRSVFANFTAGQLVGVQPMTGPVGLVYSLEYRVKDDETDEYVPLGDADYEHEDYKKNDTVGSIDVTGSAGRKMRLDVVSNAVEACSRKLQAGWTIEAMQDLNSMHGLDIEAEMTAALAQEIRCEINSEIIYDLKAIGGEAEIVELNGDTEKQLTQLSIAINRAANDIARNNRRGAGNYVVVSSALATTISESKKLNFETAEQSTELLSDLMEVGTINSGCIKVFSSTSVPDDEVLVGYKGGNGETDTGYYYCPYIPVLSSGVVVNPVTFQPVVSLMTRYGKKSTRNVKSYYRNIKVESDLFALKKDDKDDSPSEDTEV